jgi:D-alanine-D-alanine ligase
MSATRKTTVAVLFGGRSVEHDVSVVTGHQIMRAFDSARYEVVPVYITRDGRWYTGEPLLDLNNYPNEVTSHKGVYNTVLSPSTQHHGLIINPVVPRFHQKNSVKRIDVLFPAVHGTHGEDGTLQGLFELADIPYVGCGVLASALANDKSLTKQVLRQAGVPVVPDVTFTRGDWLAGADALIDRLEAEIRYPMFIKPVTLGSSIGVNRAEERTLLRAAIDVAVNFDRRVIVEEAVQQADEINCSVMGNGSQIEASVLEQPVSWEKFLTYEEKYLRGSEGMKSAERIIPAPLTPEMTAKVQQTAIAAFKAIDGRGIARIDFLVKGETVYLNEINTLPGSLSFYLWHENGLSPADVVEKLVRLAQDAHAEKRRTSYDYQTDLITMTAQRGLKGTKGSKGTKGTRSASPASQAKS